ncbi:solute carrier family 66 member 3 [Orcinus orca]|uniref:Solute carrier family 66 member 3 n=1 Tax=Tursiops truncatus TaxID=9739 RepID=A0A2U3UYG4_TURTR|nr:solute carrier family 66 member 3 [Orcinus orca]XP_004310313.1 solute carrier family 66 member 3 [Tursiops truncatus]XP_026969613.1 PQ-loop repeat-containing protein 3 [Lagenorhynchus obliquidens]XP_030700444.1 solute carrier family 66 member 3 [Globicephala melas]XP_059883622.1 solute carrier family 66 member 3 [Delphinus delphis]XP_060025531.1 solute carrier family 66 member 3 isoform X1 [Lagenorhynchus albirostris]
METRLLWFCNWSVLGVSATLKLPQIFAVLGARSARGISLPSLLLELAGFLVFLRYQCYYEYPLLTYLEYPILVAQDLILLLCVFHFKGDVKRAAPYIVLCVSAWFILTLQKWIIDLAMNLCTFISAASKFAQLQYLWKSRDSGAVSAVTWSLASYTCAARIMTTLMTTSDLTILIRFVIMLALNTWVAATILHYQKTDVKSE